MKAYVFETGLPGLSDLIHSEYDPTYTTDKRVGLGGVGTARTFAFAALVATALVGAATVEAGAVVGTGNGAIGTVTADAGAPAGVYQIVIIEPAADAGVFQVIRPDGVLDGTGNVGAAYNGTINFTLADGASNFVSGDRIPVTVSYPGAVEKDVPWDPDATDGAQTPTGLNLAAAEAPVGVDVELTVLRRGPAVVRREVIAWPEGVTDAQKAAALAALEGLGIQPHVSG